MAALEDLRDERGLTRKELAGRAGRTHQWLDKIVAGKNRISVDDAGVLAESLGVRIDLTSGSRPDVIIRAALEADRELTPEWREAIWAFYKQVKASVPRHKRSRAAASSE